MDDTVNILLALAVVAVPLLLAWYLCALPDRRPQSTHFPRSLK